MVEEGTIAAVADAIHGAESVVALTGAGMSTASGIPDFRGSDGPGPDESVWESFDPADFHRRRFDADPGGFWADRLSLQETMYDGDVEPNAAHEALATMESRGQVDAVVTQNVDGLHGAAGSETVVQLHGSNARAVCDDCGGSVSAPEAFERVRDGERPPLCRECDGVLKPDVVLFGEQLPGDELDRAQSLARESDVFLAIGSSLSVRPASLLPRIAAEAEAGGTLVIVNLEPTPVDECAAHVLREDVTTVLPALARRLADESE